MKPTHLLAGLLVIAAVLADLVLASHLPTAPDTALLWLWGSACGQLSLLGIWSVWGRTAWLIRLLGVLVAAAFLGAPLSEATNRTMVRVVPDSVSVCRPGGAAAGRGSLVGPDRQRRVVWRPARGVDSSSASQSVFAGRFVVADDRRGAPLRSTRVRRVPLAARAGVSGLRNVPRAWWRSCPCGPWYPVAPSPRDSCF